MKKFVSIILVILAISSLIGSFITISVLSSMHPTASSMEGMYYMNHYSWISWLFMFMPIGCLIFGALLKLKKNLIIGIIFSCLLFGYGCFYLIGLNTYSTDVSYLGKLETELGVALPTERTIITQDWTGGKQTSTDDNYYKYDSVARFNNSAEVNSFISNLDAQKWRTEKKPITDVIPIVSDIQTNTCEYFLLYCYETKSFSETVAMSQCNYVYMAFDVDEAVLYITEFIQKQ